MGFLNNPKLPYLVRIGQLAFAIGFLILISYAGTHRGWWGNINGALAVGAITSVFTFAVTLHAIWSHHRKNPFNGDGKLFTIIRFVVEALVFLLWIASATLMLRHKSGCENRVTDDGDRCFGANPSNGDQGHLWTDHPFISWDIALVFSFVEIVAFVASAVLIFMENRSKQAPAGASYA